MLYIIIIIYYLFFWERSVYLNRGLHNSTWQKYSSCKALHRDCAGVLVQQHFPQKQPLEDGTREAPYDDGTQGLKSKSTMEDIKDSKLLFSNKWTMSEIIVWRIRMLTITKYWI